MAKATGPAARAKAEALGNDTTTKKIEHGMDQMAGMASKFSEYAEGGAKVFADSTAASTEILREIGARSMNLLTQTMEQGVELSQALTQVRDPREAMELQSGFAKTLFSAYTAEMVAQTELCLSAWRDAAKPFMTGMAGMTR